MKVQNTLLDLTSSDSKICLARGKLEGIKIAEIEQ